MKLFKNIFFAIITFVVSFYFGNKKAEADIPSVAVAGGTTRSTSNGTSVVVQNTVLYRADGSVSVMTTTFTNGVAVSTTVSQVLSAQGVQYLQTITNGVVNVGGVNINLGIAGPGIASITTT